MHTTEKRPSNEAEKQAERCKQRIHGSLSDEVEERSTSAA
jgi:hypothetical protein